MTLVDDLKAAKALISEPKNWTKGVYGAPGCAHCVMGAVFEVAGSHSVEAQRVRAALSKALPPAWYGRPVGFYNDAAKTTHADILALFDRAIAAAEASAS